MALISSQSCKALACGGYTAGPSLSAASHLHQRRQLSQPRSLRWHSSKTPTLTPPCLRLKSRRSSLVKVEASSAAAAPQPSSSDESPQADSGPVAKFKALLSPFSEASTNKKLLALCAAQALSSVATLVHDTYLPVYLSEELKLSNTKAG